MQPLLHTKSTVFKFAGLPYCSNGIKVMLDIIDAVAESEWVYDTTPQLDHRDNARNTLSGTFYTTPGKGETTLIVCAKQIVVIQEPVGYSAEITTEASSLLYRQEGIIVLFYTVNIILNGAQPLSPFGSPKLTFKVYNVMAGDDLEVGYCPGASVTNSLKDNSLILEITRPLGDAFEEFSLDIMAQRARSTWSRIMIPKIVPVGGNLISDTILFEDLGDQPLSYRWPNNEGWKYLHREKEKRWTHEFTQSTPMIDGGPHLEIAFAGDPLGPIGPCQQLTPEQDNIITNVSYAVYTPRELKGDGVYELQLTVTYSLNELGYNRRVFSIFTDQWDFLVLLFNDTEASGELFIPCNSESNTRAIMNVVPAVCSWYSEGKDIVMDSYWRKLGKVVELTKDGEIITSVKNKHSKKTRGKRLLDITEYVCLELPYITDRKVDLLKFEFHGRSNLNGMYYMA